MKFRSKPREIEAWQFEMSEDGQFSSTKGVCQSHSCYHKNPFMHVHTIHNGQIVKLEKGDWIVPEPDGVHYYPIKDEILRSNYEPIE